MTLSSFKWPRIFASIAALLKLREEKKKHVRTVLAILKPAQAQLLLLRNTGLSYRELSDLLKLKRGSIGTLLARAEAEFEKRYCALYGGEP